MIKHPLLYYSTTNSAWIVDNYPNEEFVGVGFINEIDVPGPTITTVYAFSDSSTQILLLIFDVING